MFGQFISCLLVIFRKKKKKKKNPNELMGLMEKFHTVKTGTLSSKLRKETFSLQKPSSPTGANVESQKINSIQFQ